MKLEGRAWSHVIAVAYAAVTYAPFHDNSGDSGAERRGGSIESHSGRHSSADPPTIDATYLLCRYALLRQNSCEFINILTKYHGTHQLYTGDRDS